MFGGRTRAIMFDPNDPSGTRVFAGGVAGGLWYTDDITDSNEPWTNVDDFWSNIAVSAIAHDPTDTDVWYVGTGEGYFNIDAMRGGGIFKSTDGGDTWNILPSTSGSGFRNIQKLIVTDAGTVLAATKGGAGIARSTDGGSNWTTVLDNDTHPAAESSRGADLEVAANGDIFAAMGLLSQGQVFKSQDDGQTWEHSFGDTTDTPAASRQFFVERIEMATAPTDSNRVYLIAQNDSTYGIDGMWRSVDGGDSWQSITLPVDCSSSIGSDISRGQGWYNLILAVNPTDEDHVLVGAINILRSTDGGSTWSNISRSNYCAGKPYVHPDQHALVYRPGSSTGVAIGNDGGVYYAPNVTSGGVTFTNRNNGYNVTQYYSAAQSPTASANLLVGGTQDNGTPKLNAAGASEQIADVTSGDGAYTHINQVTNTTAFASNQWITLHYSSNGGQSFSGLVSYTGGGSFINPSDLDEGTDHLFFNYNSTGIGRMEPPPFSGTPSAQLVGPSGGMGNSASAIRASPFAPAGTATVYVGTRSGRLYKAEDIHDGGSTTWSLISLPPGSPGAISSIDFGAGEDTVLVTISNYGKKSVWITYDGGSEWVDLDTGSNLPDVPVWWGMLHPDNPRKVLIGTEAGLWYSEDITAETVSWGVDSEIPITRVVTLRYRPSDRQIMAATHGRGVWTATLLESSPDTPELDATILLEGAYDTGSQMAVPTDFEEAVPLNQPYTDPHFDGTPLDYDGIESVGSLPAGVVDWILVSLRTSPDASDEVAGALRAAFVKTDGSIIGLDGSPLAFTGVAAGDYHVIVRHRNHLAVMSRNALAFGAAPVTVDFTSDTTVAHVEDGPPMKEVSSGVWAMAAADADADGQVTVPDFNSWLAASKIAATGYVVEDFDMDGQVTVSDFNVFLANTSAGLRSQVPD